MSSELIRALQDAALYDHPVQGFQLVETHISWVILTGDYAYKIKKPVNFGFLDFSNLESRHRFCEKELELNSRLAPQLYLKVLPITGSPTRPQLNGKGAPIEYAVQMRQFDQNQLLNRLHERNELTLEHIEELTGRIADFHQRIARADSSSDFGLPDQVLSSVKQNFEQIRPRLTAPSELAQLFQLEAWARDTFARLRPVLIARQQSGFVRECHGDIHLGNIMVLDHAVTPFDGIEFNESLRWIDVMSDIAFLIMDLEERGLQCFANHAVNGYLERTGDYAGLKVLNFYKAYRAMVRAKVALLTRDSANGDEHTRAALHQQYLDYVNLAETYTLLPNRCLLITHGVSGSGKSTLGLQLADRLGVVRLRSDLERKRLQGLDALARSGSALDGGIYTAQSTDATYRRLAELADLLLGCGYSVLVDATFLRRSQRELLENVAEAQGVPFVILSCEADQATIRSWILQREANQNDASEAGLQVLDKQLAHLEPLDRDEQAHRIVARTDQPQMLEPLLESLARRLGLDVIAD